MRKRQLQKEMRWEKEDISCRGKSRCKDPVMGKGFVCSRKTREARVKGERGRFEVTVE